MRSFCMRFILTGHYWVLIVYLFNLYNPESATWNLKINYYETLAKR